MKAKPWLEKEDPRWAQQVKWNNAREITLGNWDNNRIAQIKGKECPLIEEAQWYLSIIYMNYGIERSSARKLFYEAPRTPRSLAYFGIIDHRNLEMIRQAAIMGDPLAQNRLAFLDHHQSAEEADVWLKKSMAGGYSEAFPSMARRHAARGQLLEQKLCLMKGIDAGSITAMNDYGDCNGISELEMIYWRGRAWLETPFRKGAFTMLCQIWHSTCLKRSGIIGDMVEQGFVYGCIVNRLTERRLHNLSQDQEWKDIHVALCRVRDVYLKMCKGSSRAVYSWILVGKKLGVVKDIIGVIARMVWATRDQSEWLDAV